MHLDLDMFARAPSQGQDDEPSSCDDLRSPPAECHPCCEPDVFVWRPFTTDTLLYASGSQQSQIPFQRGDDIRAVAYYSTEQLGVL